MARLAINGHETRGVEVIELLEMLGGINRNNLTGAIGTCVVDPKVYFIENNNIYWSYYGGLDCDGRLENMYVFTLEEFENKYPYKVGDKVIDIDCPDEIGEVFELYWDDSINDMLYRVQFKADDYWYAIDDIKLFERKYEFDGRIKNENDECGVILNQLEKELDEAFEQETSEEYFSNEPEPQPKAPILSNRYDYADGKCGYVIPDGYEFDYIKDSSLFKEIILKPKKAKYPTTYKECCEVLCIGTMDNDAQGYKADLIIRFQELIIARNAYWKIAGEELGLDKPWEPDWKDSSQQKYTIFYYQDEASLSKGPNVNRFLSFPTEEIRDIFYENFKNLIENCKELL